MGKYVSVYAYEDRWLGRWEGGISDISLELFSFKARLVREAEHSWGAAMAVTVPGVVM